MKSILIVEDDFLLSMINGKYLEIMGYKIAGTASSGEQAVELARTTHPDLILMDIRLGAGMNGIDAMKEIATFSKAPVIYLTGNSTDEMRAKESTSHLAAFCVKPVHFEELQQIIQTLWAKQE